MEGLVVVTALPALLAVIGCIVYLSGVIKENADRKFNAAKWLFAALVFGVIDIVAWILWFLEMCNIL